MVHRRCVGSCVCEQRGGHHSEQPNKCIHCRVHHLLGAAQALLVSGEAGRPSPLLRYGLRHLHPSGWLFPATHPGSATFYGQDCLHHLLCQTQVVRYLHRLQKNVLYYDTDSVIYRWKEGQTEIETGDFLGQMTYELDGDTIEEFGSIAEVLDFHVPVEEEKPSSLCRHRKVCGTASPKLSCPNCTSTFTQASNLKRHIIHRCKRKKRSVTEELSEKRPLRRTLD